MRSNKPDVPVQQSGEGAVTGRMIRGYYRMRAGIITPLEYVLMCFDKGTSKFFGWKSMAGAKLMTRRIIRELEASGNLEQEYYRLKDAKIPILNELAADFFSNALLDVFYIYLYLNDNYNEKDINKYFYILPEGPYSLVNELVDVRVKAGDVVIDAGSWIGDFAAYASAKGAGKVYAFEPFDDNYDVLTKTASLNKNIVPVKKALSSSSGRVNMTGKSGTANVHEDKDGHTEMTSIDEFVRENNLGRVDFIKADIEGLERNMLEGAQETLRRFAPKLALCTYHRKDDPEVMASLILKANPEYNIVQKRMKLFASVPEN